MHHKIEFDQECKDCKGTGLYIGFAEKDGFAVVCHTCKGTGCKHVVFEYDDFEGKKKRNNVVQIVETNPGIGLGVNDELTYESFGGMSYKDWFEGKPFPKNSEMRKFTCPAWWYQSVDYDKKPKWCYDIHRFVCGTFSGCSGFNCKEKCWERFDKENQ